MVIGFLPWLSGHDEAKKNKNDDTQRTEDENATREQDRAGFGGEWSGLVGEWGGDFAPPAILEKDGFPAMTHQQIYEALEGVDAGLINDKATAWRSLADEARAANKEFLDGVNADLEAGWNGESGRAAVDGVRAFSTSFDSLAASFHMVAHGLGLIETHLGHAKVSVGKPDNETIGDKVLNVLPDDLFKTPQYRADEAQETARWVMTTYYEPGAGDVDGKTPILPEPQKPVDDGKPDSGRPPGPGGTDTGGNGTDSGGNGTDPGTEDGTNPEDQGQPGEPEDPPGTEPPATEPQSTESQDAPAPTTPQSATPTTPSTTTGAPSAPGMPGGAPSGAPPGGPQGAPPLPGQSVPGVPGAGPAGAPAPAAPGAATGAGRGGAPGMMGGGGARGAGKDDEDEHKTPDYLVYDRGSELLGTQPPALPPGGVIGA